MSRRGRKRRGSSDGPSEASATASDASGVGHDAPPPALSQYIPDGVGDIAPEDLGRESYGSLGLSLPGGLPLQKRRPGLPLGPVTAAIAAGTGRDRARARPSCHRTSRRRHQSRAQ